MIIGKVVCPDCNGNGYVGGSKDEDLQKNCSKCDNQGEIKITEETLQEFFRTIKSARLQ